jgi:hypothetical protein
LEAAAAAVAVQPAAASSSRCRRVGSWHTACAAHAAVLPVGEERTPPQRAAVLDIVHVSQILQAFKLHGRLPVDMPVHSNRKDVNRVVV